MLWKKSDKRINNTVISGKAFEYATLIEIYNILQEKGWEKSQLEIKDDKNYSSIARAYVKVSLTNICSG